MVEKRQLSVRMALEWAFITECARMDLDDGKGAGRASFGTEYTLMQRLKLGGVKIDVSGGRSFPHHDADIIAAAVTRLALLPRMVGLGILVAEMAQTGRVPNWMPGARPKIEPLEWRPAQGYARRPMGKSEVIRRYQREIVTPNPKYPGKTISRRVKVEEEWVPCHWITTLQEIESARATYTRWVVALEWIRDKLQRDGDLETITITDRLPPHCPWNASIYSRDAKL